MNGYDVRMTTEFGNWLDQLADLSVQMRIVARLRQVQAGNLGDWRSIGDGLSELRIHAGPGYRLYFTRRGRMLVVMLAGGDKSTQSRDIVRAISALKTLDIQS